MTSDEIRAAAERRRAEDYQRVLTESGWVAEGCDDDNETLADAYLDEHHADDDEAADIEWLDRVGFDCRIFRPSGRQTATILIDDFGKTAGAAHVDLQLVRGRPPEEWVTDVYSFGEDGTLESCVGLVRSWCKTRGDVRRLCRALGVELTERGG